MVQSTSSCPKTKIIKSWFEDQEDTGITPKDKAGIEDVGCAAAAAAAWAAAAASPASWTKRIHQCTYTVQWCLYISWNVCNYLYTRQPLTYIPCNGLYMVCTCLYELKQVHTCIYMSIHVWTRYIHVHTSTFSEMYIYVYTFLELSPWLSSLHSVLSGWKCNLNYST